ncbi:hypothetical protein BH10CYA1_BH10CYA1_50110 [soil metagenome]
MPNLSGEAVFQHLPGDPPIAAKGSSFYLPQLDGLRACAFLYVFLFHAWQIPEPHPHFFLIDWYNRFIQWGLTGVDLFFVLSGYLITFLLLKEQNEFGNISFLLYFKRRILRIWPLFYCAIIFGALLIPALSHRHLQWSTYSEFLTQIALPMMFFVGNYALMFGERALDIFALAVNFPVANLFKPLWSVCIEEQFYVLWPLILKSVRTSRSLIWIIFALTVLSMVSRYFFQQISTTSSISAPQNLYYYNTICRLDPLMAGATVALIESRFPRWATNLSKYSAYLAMAGFAFITSIIIFVPSNTNTVAVVPLYFLFALSYALILSGANHWKPLQVFLSHPMLRDVGKITYGMYIVHHPIIVLTEHFLRRRLQMPYGVELWIATTLSALLLTYFVAKLLWFLIESKTQRLRKKFARTA